MFAVCSCLVPDGVAVFAHIQAHTHTHCINNNNNIIRNNGVAQWHTLRLTTDENQCVCNAVEYVCPINYSKSTE